MMMERIRRNLGLTDQGAESAGKTPVHDLSAIARLRRPGGLR
jgi:hypothetical protein